jgi:uncharacterized membrane protein
LTYAYAAACLLGCVAGLRTFTAPAVLWLVRHRSPIAYVLAIAALVELAADLYPKTPARTAAAGLVARILSGAACGWAVTLPAGGSVAVGALLGVVGALIGAYGGLAVRVRAIDLIGRVPAALLEDAVAIFGAVAVVLMLAPA